MNLEGIKEGHLREFGIKNGKREMMQLYCYLHNSTNSLQKQKGLEMRCKVKRHGEISVVFLITIFFFARCTVSKAFGISVVILSSLAYQ